MKKQLYSKIVLFLFLLQILQFSQFNVKATDGSGVKVAVTISAMATVIGPILLPQDNITVLLPANVEPHSFTLDPITLDKAMQADIIVTSGHIGWEDQLEKIAAEKGKIVFNPLKELYNNPILLEVSIAKFFNLPISSIYLLRLDSYSLAAEGLIFETILINSSAVTITFSG